MGVADDLLRARQGDNAALFNAAMNEMAPILMELATVCAGRPTPAVVSAAVNLVVIACLELMDKSAKGQVLGVSDQATRAWLQSVGHDLIALSQRRGDIPLDERLVAAREQMRRPWPPVRS